jgi:hypothetical protein
MGTQVKFKNSQLLRRVQSGARTYLLLAGVGTAAIIAAPFAAAFVLLKPSNDPAKKKRQDAFFKDLKSSINLAGDRLQKAFKEFDFDSIDDLLDPSSHEPWKQQHRKQHDMSDQEYFRNADQD